MSVYAVDACVRARMRERSGTSLTCCYEIDRSVPTYSSPYLLAHGNRSVWPRHHLRRRLRGQTLPLIGLAKVDRRRPRHRWDDWDGNGRNLGWNLVLDDGGATLRTTVHDPMLHGGHLLKHTRHVGARRNGGR